MTIREIIQEEEKLGGDYDSRFVLLLNTSEDIFSGRIRGTKEDLLYFLNSVIGTEYMADFTNRIGLTTKQIKLSIKLNNNCLEIIRKFNVSNLKVRRHMLYSVGYYEKDEERKKLLEKELSLVQQQLKRLG